jgi:hypothetical protein
LVVLRGSGTIATLLSPELMTYRIRVFDEIAIPVGLEKGRPVPSRVMRFSTCPAAS